MPNSQPDVGRRVLSFKIGHAQDNSADIDDFKIWAALGSPVMTFIMQELRNRSCHNEQRNSSLSYNVLISGKAIVQ
jgi:hypothetical protein